MPSRIPASAAAHTQEVKCALLKAIQLNQCGVWHWWCYWLWRYRERPSPYFGMHNRVVLCGVVLQRLGRILAFLRVRRTLCWFLLMRHQGAKRRVLPRLDLGLCLLTLHALVAPGLVCLRRHGAGATHWRNNYCVTALTFVCWCQGARVGWDHAGIVWGFVWNHVGTSLG